MRSPSVVERWALALAGVTLLLALNGLGGADVTGDDEAREVGIIQDVLRGNVFTARFNDTLIPDKPILFHWTAAAVAGALGFSETTVRLTSAVAASVTAGTVVVTGARLFGPAAGVASGALLATTPSFIDRARVARPDMLLVCLLTLALASAWQWWDRRDRRAATATWVLLGLATATKGPVAAALFGATLGGFALWQRARRRLPAFFSPAGIGAAVVLGGAWYVIAALTWGDDFVAQHLVGRYVRNMAGGLASGGSYSPKPLVYHATFYPLHLPLIALPWSPLVAVAIWRAWHDDRASDPRFRWLACAALAPVIVFTPAEWKLRYYLLPSLPALALLAGPVVARVLDARPHPPTRASVILAALVAMLAVATSALVLAEPAWLAEADRHRLEALLDAVPGGATAIGVASGMLAGLLASLLAFHAWNALLGVVVAAMLGWLLIGMPALERAESRAASLRPFATAVAQWAAAGSDVAFWAEPVRQVVVYADRSIPTLERRREALRPGLGLILGSRAYDRLAADGVVGEALVTGTGRVDNMERGTLVLARVR